MSDRDELARVLLPWLDTDGRTQGCVDDLWAAGWRKKPSKRDLLRLTTQVSMDGAGPMATADAVLALLDGPTETGEK